MNNKKKILVVAMTLSMVAILAIGGTIAYFTADDNALNNFAIGDVQIQLDEAIVTFDEETDEWTADEDVDDESRRKHNDYDYIYPGADLPKDPTVRNPGTNDAYVRVTVSMDPIVIGHLVAGTEVENATSGEQFEYLITNEKSEIGEGWSFLKEETVWDMEALMPTEYKITYYYEEPLEGNYYRQGEMELKDFDCTTPLFTNIHIPEVLETMYDYQNWQLNLHAEAIQAETFDSARDAWSEFDGVDYTLE